MLYHLYVESKKMIQRNLQNRNGQTLKTNLWLYNNNKKIKNNFLKKENKFMVIKEETL